MNCMHMLGDWLHMEYINGYKVRESYKLLNATNNHRTQLHRSTIIRDFNMCIYHFFSISWNNNRGCNHICLISSSKYYFII